MESMLVLLGMLFFMFLILSAAVEAVLEVFRGLLEHFGITWARSKLSLEDALQLSREFAPPNSPELAAKIEALKTAAQQMQHSTESRLQKLDQLKADLLGDSTSSEAITGKLGKLALTIKGDIDQHNRRRVFITRFAATIVGSLLTWQSEFYVFHILASAPESKEWFASLSKLQSAPINILVGGLAASAGSSYWHDQLSKVRNLKAAASSLTVIGK